MTDTADLRDRPLDQLSGGQRQRAWIAMTLAQDTDLLLLDEPTTYLDLAHQVEVLDLVTRLNRERGRTVVMVLHDLNLAARYSDLIVVMKDGAIVDQGAPAEVFTPAMLAETSASRPTCSPTRAPASRSSSPRRRPGAPDSSGRDLRRHRLPRRRRPPPRAAARSARARTGCSAASRSCARRSSRRRSSLMSNQRPSSAPWWSVEDRLDRRGPPRGRATPRRRPRRGRLVRSALIEVPNSPSSLGQQSRGRSKPRSTSIRDPRVLGAVDEQPLVRRDHRCGAALELRVVGGRVGDLLP